VRGELRSTAHRQANLMRRAEEDGLLDVLRAATGAGERMPFALSCSSATCRECWRARKRRNEKLHRHLLECLAQAAFTLGERLA
jgi:hypothetical protein